MATVSDITTTPLSGLNHIDALLDTGPDWNYATLGGNTIYYSFSVTSGNEDAATTQKIFTGSQQAFSAAQQAVVRALLNDGGYLNRLTGIHFAEAGSTTDAQIHFANVNLIGGNVTGLCSWHSSYGYAGNQLSSYSGDAYVYLDNVEWRAANGNLAPGGQGYETLLHEMGHALGLKHSFDTTTDNTATLSRAQDNTSNTLMSYTEGPASSYATYQQYDIAALNWLYGGDGLRGAYGINSASGGRYITGTSGADILTGTAANDKLEGDGGNDMIDGGAGTDTAVFHDDRGNYTFNVQTNGDLQVTSRSGIDGTDILHSIEYLEFAGDNVVSADTIRASVALPAGPQLTVAKNGNGYAPGNVPSVTGSADPYATVKIFTSNNVQVGTATADGNGLYTTKLTPFADGLNYQVYAIATDTAGHASAPTPMATFSIDAHAPGVPTVSLSYSAGSNQATFSGTGEAGTEIQLVRVSDLTDIVYAQVGSDGNWSVTTSALPNGSYDLSAISVDKAGNATSSNSRVAFNVSSKLNVAGTDGNDKILAPVAGNNAIDGKTGVDTVVYAGTRDSYTVAKEVWGFGVTDKSGNGGHDALINVERVQFSDGYLALDTDGITGQLFRLYQAVFDRAPDHEGLGYWIYREEQGASLKEIAQEFTTYPEFVEKYGTAPTNEEFVTHLYQNVLHRQPEGAGFNFWVNGLDNGATRGDVIVNFSESPENQVQVIGSIQNGMTYLLYTPPA